MDDYSILRAAVRSVIPRVSIAERLAPILPEIQAAIDAGASASDLAVKLTANMHVRVTAKNLTTILYRNRVSGRLEHTPKSKSRSRPGPRRRAGGGDR